MSQLAAHNLAMSNFYGTHQGDLSGSQKGEEQQVQGAIRYVSMIVGLLSLFTIIALNVTNIIYMTESGGTMQSIKTAQGSIDGSMREISGVIMEDVKPKTDLINSMVSYNIPAQLSMIHQIIKNDVLKQCTPSFMFNNTICPLAENPTHSRYFEEVNLDSISECSGPDMHLGLGVNPEFIEFPSFAPGSTKPGSCVRLPSFSLSTTVFAYTHTIMGHGCSELDVGDHYFSVGRIADAGHEIPQFETISSWFINDKINRRSCTVAAGAMEAWMGCVIMTETFYDDLNSLDTGKLTISYLDVFGRKKEWIYTRSEILYDYTYTSVYFSVGSGVVVGDTVYFLIWGSLSSPIEETAYCFAPDCNNYNQRMCNEAQRPSKFGHRQMVNGILKFKTTSTGKPLLSVGTLSPSVVPFGSEGRLMYSEITKIIYLYLRSTSWHALPLTGLFVLGPPTSISWIVQRAVSRPGEFPCGASNRCPKDCVTGVYTDLFPLGSRYEYAATVYLNSETYRVNPTLALINQTNIIASKKVTTESQRAGYTTTTCFVFKLRVWCISVVELAPSTMTAYEPIPFLYQLDLTCKGKNGSLAMQFTGKEGTYKTGRYKSPRNECFFEKVSNKYYFIVSTPEGIQPYEIRDLTPDRMPHIIMYISDVCAPALSAFKKLLPAMRPITTLTIGNWQFRPVEVSGGLRVNIGRNLTKEGDLTMSAPEDPGSNTFPGGHIPGNGILDAGYYTVEYPREWKQTTPKPGERGNMIDKDKTPVIPSKDSPTSDSSTLHRESVEPVIPTREVLKSSDYITIMSSDSGSGSGDFAIGGPWTGVSPKAPQNGINPLGTGLPHPTALERINTPAPSDPKTSLYSDHSGNTIDPTALSRSLNYDTTGDTNARINAENATHGLTPGGGTTSSGKLTNDSTNPTSVSSEAHPSASTSEANKPEKSTDNRVNQDLTSEPAGEPTTNAPVDDKHSTQLTDTGPNTADPERTSQHSSLTTRDEVEPSLPGTTETSTHQRTETATPPELVNNTLNPPSTQVRSVRSLMQDAIAQAWNFVRGVTP